MACGGPSERIKDIEATKTSSPSPTPKEREISGAYNISGAGDHGDQPYTGLLEVTPQGNVYGFRWQLTKGTRIGTGIQMGSAVAVSSAAVAAGKGCGVVLYKIAPDGSMEGKIGRWGEEPTGSEKVTRVKGTTFAGEYALAGTTPDGKPFKGKLTIKKDAAGYDFEWFRDYESQPDTVSVGFGIWKGSFAAAVFGGTQCGFSLYDIQSNGNLEGDWGGQKAVTFGTEAAKRQ